MKRRFALTVTTAMFLGTSAWADAFTDQIVTNLQQLGYTYIEVKDGPTQVKVEAVQGGQKIELVFDRSTGAILKQQVGRSSFADRNKSGVEVDQTNRVFVDGSDDDSVSGGFGTSDDDDDDGSGGSSGGGTSDDDDDSGSGGGGSSDDDRSSGGSSGGSSSDDDDGSGGGSSDDDDSSGDRSGKRKGRGN